MNSTATNGDYYRFMNASSASGIFSGGGEIGERIRNFDWSRTSIGTH